MLDIEDEYIRDYAFEPEFIQRKDSIKMHKERLEKKHKQNEKLMRKFHSLDVYKSLSEEEIAMILKTNIIDAEVYSFCTVIIE